MGKDTVSNEQRAIATRGTMHKATSLGASDRCHPKADPADVERFENWARTLDRVDSGTNTSAATLIRRMRIWIDGGLVLPLSNPRHPPHDTGERSKKPYRGPATNITCSETVFFEGRGAVRTDDHTWQNHENCYGTVDGSEVEVTADLTEDFYKNACKIKSFKGTIAAKSAISGVKVPFTDVTVGESLAEAGGNLANRVFYDIAGGSDAADAPPAEEAIVFGDGEDSDNEVYFEIHNGTEIDFEIERWDFTKDPPAKADRCLQVPDHAHWTAAQRSGEKKEDEATGTETYKLSKDLTDFGLEIESESAAVNTKTDRPGRQTTKVGLTGPPGGLEGALDVVAFFRAQKRPPLIGLRVATCGDVRQAVLAVKPAGKFEIAISLQQEDEDTSANDEKAAGLRPLQGTIDEIRRLKGLLQAAKKVSDKATALANLVGGIVTPKFDFSCLDNVRVGVSCEYRRCAYEGVGRISQEAFTTQHVRPAWTFSISASPIFGFELGCEVDLIGLAAAILSGGVLTTITSALRKVGINLLVLDLKFSIGVDATFNFGLDQHEDPLGDATNVEMAVPIVLSAAIKTGIGEGDVALVELSLTFEGSITGKLIGAPPKRPGTLMRMQWGVEFRTQCVFTGRVWRFEKPFGPWDGPSFTPPTTERDLEWPG